MKIITKPEVYLLGKQTIQQTELDRFLEDHGVTWESDSEVAAEVVTETAGRVCYMSFAKPRPGGNAAYLHHIKEVGHGCYDAETDVLTLSGWKSWPDVAEDDRLATLNVGTGLVEYHKPIRLIRFLHTGKMYRVDSQHVDLLVTPEHNMFVCPTTTKAGRKKQDYILCKAVELQHCSHAYMKSSSGSKDGWWRDCPGRDVFALLGFAIGDGNMSERSTRSIRFRLRRERKILWLTSLCRRLEALGFTLTDSDGDRFTVTLPHGDKANGLITHLFSGIYDSEGEKQIPWAESVFSGATRDGLEGLFEGLMQSDGHEGETGDSFDTTSPHLPGQFQQLCLHIGLASNVSYTYGPEQRKSSYGDKPLTRLSVIRKCLKPEVNKWSGSEGRTLWIEDWHGEVYCAEVPNNILYVRRNGKPVWSGNSVLEHAVWSFLITGVSRSLTHELVRHRAGWAYSQLSQRYVDESVAEYVEPDIIAEDKELHEIWLKSVTQMHAAYMELAEKLNAKLADPAAAAASMLPPDADRTTRRKTARQAARSILPNATETKITVTVNARALRHFLEQRGSVHAEPEIRKLANVMLDVVQKDSPNLFGDYERHPLPDGTFELTTPFGKV